MLCVRCKGVMVPDHYCDLLESSGPPLIEAWRCICCGNILDPIILQNRQMQDARIGTPCDCQAIEPRMNII